MNAPRPRVLVVEDDPPIRRFLRASLTNHEYDVVEAPTGSQALKLAPDQPPDLIILDLGLPDMDGLEVIRRLREWSSAPILIVSARGQEADKVQALDAGADDYLTKPFGMAELLARIRVALRRTSQPAEAAAPEFVLDELRVDLAGRHVYKGPQEVHLTPIEYRLLTTLIKHAGKVLTHRFLMQEVWGPPYVGQTHYLRIFMTNLRRKLEPDPARPRYFLTEQGVGYRLALDAD